MLIELFIFFEIIMLIFFAAAFFTKQEILWAVALVLSGVIMILGYNVEYYVYEFNVTTSAYMPVVTTHSYPYLTAINMLFFVLSLVLGLFDIFDKYGTRFASTKMAEKIGRARNK